MHAGVDQQGHDPGLVGRPGAGGHAALDDVLQLLKNRVLVLVGTIVVVMVGVDDVVRAKGLDVGFDVDADPGLQPRPPVAGGAAVHGVPQALQEPGGVAVAQGCQHLVLGREVVVERALGDLRLLDDLADCRGFHALGQEQLLGGGHQLVQADFGRLGPGTWWAGVPAGSSGIASGGLILLRGIRGGMGSPDRAPSLGDLRGRTGGNGPIRDWAPARPAVRDRPAPA